LQKVIIHDLRNFKVTSVLFTFIFLEREHPLRAFQILRYLTAAMSCLTFSCINYRKIISYTRFDHRS